MHVYGIAAHQTSVGSFLECGSLLPLLTSSGLSQLAAVIKIHPRTNLRLAPASWRAENFHRKSGSKLPHSKSIRIYEIPPRTACQNLYPRKG